MVSTLFLFSALFTSVLMLMAGVGLLFTTLSLRLSLEQVPVQIIGPIMSSYFLGLSVGSLFCHRLVSRVGYIRAFLAFASVAVMIVMLHGLLFSPLAWALLRFMSGIATVGLYTVIESWLSISSDVRTRGRVLAVYMLLSYLGMAVGQQLLNLGNIFDLELLFIIGVLFAMCMVPMAVTSSVYPEVQQPGRYGLFELVRKAPVGILGCLTSGLLTSSFYSMGPVFGDQVGLSVGELSWFMSAAIIGGFLLQWPIGKVSDRFDRIRVLIVLGGCIALTSTVMMITGKESSLGYTILVGFYGGFIFTLYPVSVARAHDLFQPDEMVAVSSMLLMVYGLGAAIGPIASANAMALVQSPTGFFGFSLLTGGLYALVAAFLRNREKLVTVSVEDQAVFMPMRRTSAVALQLDPRAEGEAGGTA